MQPIPWTVVFSTYTSTFDPGQLGRQPQSPPEFSHRSIGRPHSQRLLEGDQIRIEWPWEEHGRARKVITRSGARRRYVVPCFRGGDRYAHCEADEEADAVVLLDACAGIEFQEQPAKITFTWNQEEVEHYPDQLVVAEGIKEFWEFKRDHEARDLAVRCRTERLIDLLRPIGFGYRLVTTTVLHTGEYLENAKRMRRRAKLEIPLALRKQIAEALSADNHLKASPVLDGHFIRDNFDLLYTLLYRGDISGNLRQQITMNMTVGPARDKGRMPWVWELFERTS